MDTKNKILPLLGVILFFCLIAFPGFSQGTKVERKCTIAWEPLRLVTRGDSSKVAFFSFKLASVRAESGMLPVFSQSFPFDPGCDSVAGIIISSAVYEEFSDPNMSLARELDKISPEIHPDHSLSVTRKKTSLLVSLVPLRRNAATGKVERLVSFTLALDITRRKQVTLLKTAAANVSNSVLASGSWYKFAVGSSGIFRVTYDDLKKAGMNVAGIDPRNLRVYGNGGGMLPEANAARRVDDLRENAIFVSGESDGVFNPGDYLLFYGESPDSWAYNKTDHLFHHQKNVYTDRNCYFITADLGPGKRLGTATSTAKPATNYVTSFEDFSFYERNDVNLIKSGRIWWDGQFFDMTTSRNYTFNIPNIDNTKPVTLIADVAGRSTVGNTTFVVSAQGAPLMSIGIDAITGGFEDNYAKERSGSATFNTSNPVISVNLNFVRSSTSSVGYLHYLEINAMRLLKMAGPQMVFRSVAGTGPNNVTEFTLDGNGQNVQIWDVSNGGNILQMSTVQNGGNYSFRVETDTLRQFIAFDGSTFLAPDIIGKVANQDLHGAPVADYLIVTSPVFAAQAERLAAYHRLHDNMTVLVAPLDKIYNEFSSGVQDITAIRDFVRMMYNKATAGKEPKYLLLFGDASYDFKSRTQNNTNYVPAYESVESLSPTDSFVSDDYFGLLDPDEGQSDTGSLDIGVGRFPVSSADQANKAVDKVIQYCSNSDTVKNDWRNVVTFVADDQNLGGNLFIDDSEDLAGSIDTYSKDYNIDKIYSDSYTMESTPGGPRYPDVNADINKRVEKGCLIMNYVGHGGEVGWAHERILEVPDIQNWNNIANLPVFVTATCEFSRFDDPTRTSAGEWVFLNSHGGGIALFTTTRLTYAGTNKTLLVNFYNNVFKKTAGSYLKMGDLLVAAKNNMGSSANIHAFVLLGDPAIQIAYPDLNVVTTAINGHQITLTPDTLKALSEVTIAGEVRNESGQVATSFSGTIFPTVFDKSSEIWTKANQQEGPPVKFYLRKNPVYKGKVKVTNGLFQFSFLVPKDIAYQFGVGKISYYAKSPETDANGYSDNIQVGGYNNHSSLDTQGPDLALYINNRNFISGGITSENPVLLADVSDSSGVNTVGNGIGHDLTATLDNKTTTPMILNDYYVSNLDTYKSGKISYPLFGVADGPHTIVVKIWDVYNNSTEASIDFVVVSSAELAFEHLFNYPNPMKDHTTFSWESNQVNQSIDVEISIFTINGIPVKTIRERLSTNSFHMASVHWDGTQDDGQKIASGLYLYKAKLIKADGTVKGLSSKLVVIR
ncbi:MAG: type IX secretion system sortase PorU [Bacteroidota bacterium]